MMEGDNPGFTAVDMKDMLAKYPDGLDILEYLVNNMMKTETTMKSKLSEDGADVLFLNILSRAASCPIRKEKAILLLSSMRNSVFFKVGLGELILSYDLFSEDVEEFCTIAVDCIDIVTKLSLTLPSAKTEVIGLIKILQTKIEESLPDIQSNLHGNHIHKILDDLANLQEAVVKSYLVNDTTNHTRIKKKLPHADMKPPDNFRKIPILPRVKDVLNPREFLRANKAIGGYVDLNHYLDVQFRLFREDCITPLREGIAEYVRERANRENVGRLQDGRLYKDVKVLWSEYSIDGLLVTIQINSDHSSDIDWATSQRLLYGSLVCLSSDHFNSLYFGVVANSERKTIAKDGTFVVLLEDDTTDIQRLFNCKLTMIESTAYFEAYRHVLSCLQKIQDGDFPFEKYIVHCIKDMESPKYLSNRSALYDFHPVVAKDWICKYEIVEIFHPRERELSNVDIFSPISLWPTPKELHLDESQFQAFHSALTEEFVLIQGPPGTGKTYVGLQIAKTLLHNRDVWNERIRVDDDGKIWNLDPMLIVCFTNHALDQFLEGIVKLHDSNTNGWKEGIVRVGGRCKSPLLETFALKKRRWPYRHSFDEDVHFHRIERIRSEICRGRWCIKHCKKFVLSPITLSEIIPQKHARCFKIRRFTKSAQHHCQIFDKESIAKWLGVSESNWIKRARQAYSRELEKKHLSVAMHPEAELALENSAIDVNIDVKQANNNVRIIEESYDIGLDVLQLLQKILLKYEAEQNIDQVFKYLLKKGAEAILKRLESNERMSYDKAFGIKQNLWQIPYEQRWSLYRHWVEIYCNRQEELLQQLKMEKAEIHKNYQREKQGIDKKILSESTVIAMTTTGAAKYHDVLKEIGPKIIIVEEAAEVLEAHVIATLTPKCEHLILIGDHKQLQPKPSVYELEIQYNLGISLFERMINNGLPYHCLQRQHRMRPEISSLVRHIYPNLIDNENVEQYEKINGVSKNVFFITHDHHEEKQKSIRSYINRHEAQYIVRLHQYLMLQGYNATQITVLTAYNGQMFCIRELMPDVQVFAVDNYQGEENDIVLLSLTRSNKEGIIGFLKKENRICVALSRAKKGLYVIGNFSLLSEKSSLWEKLTKDMRKAKAIGDALPLYCCNHPEKTIMAKLPRDFDKVPDGGCSEKCDYRLECGHVCRLKCHPKDREHKEYKCVATVDRILRCKHLIKMKCHENPHKQLCEIKVRRKMETCGHEIEMKCSQDPLQFLCNVIVSQTLNCGHEINIQCSKVKHAKCESKCLKICKNNHVCQKPCHVGTSCKCDSKVEKPLPNCNHTQLMECYRDPSSEKCTTKIKIMIPKCQHILEIDCGEDINLVKCCAEVNKRLPVCGHENKMLCYINSEEFTNCNKMVSKILKCGHSIHVKCGDLDQDVECIEMVEKYLPCGHLMKMKCSDDALTALCRQKITILSDSGYISAICSDTNFKDVRCQQNFENKNTNSEQPDEIFNEDRCEENMITLPCGHKTTLECPTTTLMFNGKVQQSATRSQFSIIRNTIDDTLSNDIKCILACEYMLTCGHFCSGRCSDCSQSGLHLPCNNSCAKKLICGHDCQSQTCGACKPCQQICPFYCSHRNCEHLCNSPCEPCKRPCSWSCPHYKCTKLCHEQCDRPKCNKRCQKMLKCKHQCMGFCGEPCPSSCDECSTEMEKRFVDEIIFNNCGILVALHECRHEILAEELDEIFRNIDNCTLIFPQCPLCSADIRWHPRYGNVLNGIKNRQNQLKRTLASKIGKAKQQLFPIIRPKFGAIRSYLEQCNTFLFAQQNELRGSSDMTKQQCKIVLSLVTKMLHALNDEYLEYPCEQNLHDLYNQVYYLAGQWILFLALHGFQEIKDISSEDSDEEETENCQGAVGGVTRLKQIKPHHCDMNDFENTRDILKMPLHVTYLDLCQIISIMRPYINDLGQLFVASNCPVFDGMMNVHVEDWEMCERGHLQPKSGHRRACIMCNTKREPNLDIFLETGMKTPEKSRFKQSAKGTRGGHNKQDYIQSSRKETYNHSACRDKGRRGGKKLMTDDIKSNDHRSVPFQTKDKKQEGLPLQKSKFKSDDRAKEHTNKLSSQQRQNRNTRRCTPNNNHNNVRHKISEVSDREKNIPQVNKNKNE